ncbi:MAG: hypothetical protein M3295_00590 [Chloroflexota bacterium]|nr:hypothetical protein [Chloroflexota bacterium]
MTSNPHHDEFARRHGLGPELVSLVTRDGRVASVHRHRSGGEIWLVDSQDDDDGGDTSAVADAGVATTLSNTTLMVGGISPPGVIEVEIAVRGGAKSRRRPSAAGAWIAAFENVSTPTALTIVERDDGDRVVRQQRLDFRDGPERRVGPFARALQWSRVHVDLPGPLALPRGSTTYPAPRRRRVVFRR